MPKYSSTVISSSSGVSVISTRTSRDGEGVRSGTFVVGFVVHSIMSIIYSFQFAKLQLFPDMERKKSHWCPRGKIMHAHLLLLLLSSSATLSHFFFLKSGTLIFAFFGITITSSLISNPILPQFCLNSAFTLPSLYLRFAFALEVEKG